MQKKKPKYLTKEEALQKLERYCAYQDRCHQEVRQKLLDLGVYGEVLEEVIVELIQENFLNEERFACSYVRGKYRMKKWGRNRILQELKLRRISAYCIKKGMAEIEEQLYERNLIELLDKKNRLLKETNPFKRKAKLAAYLIQKGYESTLVWETIKERLP